MLTGDLGKLYKDGEIIIRQGEEGNCMYVIQEGQVEVFLQEGDIELQLVILKEGEFFGEMALVDCEVRTASVRALGLTRVITIDKKNFLRNIHENPILALRLAEVLSQRIRDLNDEISRLSGTGGP
jgi:CRP-like cAMP-binding protein